MTSGSPAPTGASLLCWEPYPEGFSFLLAQSPGWGQAVTPPTGAQGLWRSSLRPSVSITQELPKYLRGFHKCSREDAIHLAGLIYKAQFGNDRAHLASIPKILRELVPENLTRLMSSEEWRKVLDGLGRGPSGCCLYRGPRRGQGCQALPGQDEHIPGHGGWTGPADGTRSPRRPQHAGDTLSSRGWRTHSALSAPTLASGRQALLWTRPQGPMWRARLGRVGPTGPHWPSLPAEHPSGL